MDAATIEARRRWQDFHERQEQGPLTGSKLSSYCRHLGIDRKVFRRGLRVLEIGVGFGHATREMVAAGCIVSVLDICERALVSVRDVAAACYLNERIEELPDGAFDLAVSLLVTQHMSEHDLAWQFPHVYRSLAPNGRFVVQWAGSDVVGENNDPRSILDRDPSIKGPHGIAMFNGRMVRDERYAAELVCRFGGEVVETRARRSFPVFRSYWFVTETRRADA